MYVESPSRTQIRTVRQNVQELGLAQKEDSVFGHASQATH